MTSDSSRKSVAAARLLVLASHLLTRIDELAM